MLHPRITHDPAVMNGKPCIRGLRVTVSTIQALLTSGETRERILQAYPYLEEADLDAVLAYAGEMKIDYTFLLISFSIVYPVLLLAWLFLTFPPPHWLLEYSVFIILVLPVFTWLGLYIAKLNHVRITWPSVIIVPLWISLVNWLFCLMLEAAVASC
ncbi:MAG TPA: DUF433 domain-containing protein [Gemmatales bacterium]|nr:DUF433 domain-containing protein [Gemmatales bacterium]